MKKFTHKLAALGLSLVLSAGLLSGCGESYDPIQEAFGIPGSTVMMTVDEKEVHASDLYYWLAYNADYIKQYYSIMGGEEGAINWDDTLGGTQSVKDYVKEEAKQTAVLYNAVLSNTAAAGYAFDSDDPQYTKELEAAKSNLGGEEAFARFLKEMCLTEDSFETLNSVAVVYDHMRQGLYRSGGEFEPTKEELDQFIQDKDLLAARHMAEKQLTVAQAEQYVDRRLTALQSTPPAGRQTYIIKDVRLFLNSLDRGLRIIRDAGVDAACGREETEDDILLTIRIPKHRR